MARPGIHGWGALGAGLGQGFAGGVGQATELKLKLMLMQKQAKAEEAAKMRMAAVEEASRRRLATEDDARAAERAAQASRLGYASSVAEGMEGSPEVLASYRDELLRLMSRAPSLDLTTPPNLNLSPAAQAQNVQGMTEASRKDQLQSLLAAKATRRPQASMFPRPESFLDSMKQAAAVVKSQAGIRGTISPWGDKERKSMGKLLEAQNGRRLTQFELDAINSYTPDE